jgi:hypothetical protein
MARRNLRNDRPQTCNGFCGGATISGSLAHVVLEIVVITEPGMRRNTFVSFSLIFPFLGCHTKKLENFASVETDPRSPTRTSAFGILSLSLSLSLSLFLPVLREFGGGNLNRGRGGYGLRKIKGKGRACFGFTIRVQGLGLGLGFRVGV